MRFVDDDEVVVPVQDLLPVGQDGLVGQVAVVPDELVGAQRSVVVDRPAVGADDLPGGDPAPQLARVEVVEPRLDVVGDARPRAGGGDSQAGGADAVPDR